MTWKAKPHILRFLGRTKGAIAVEFAIIFPLFLLLVAGVIDFGHAYFMKQTITNASREGARYGITWSKTAPNLRNPTIGNVILNTSTENGGMGKPGYGLKSLLPSDANPAVSLGGTGYTTGDRGSPLEVTVTATKHWFMVSSFIPGLGSQKTLTAKTVMRCEGN